MLRLEYKPQLTLLQKSTSIIERRNMQDLKEELREAFLLAKNTLPQFREKITRKNTVIFLGNTRSGKSTLINYFIGTKLKSFKIRKNLYKIEKSNDNDHGPHIGQGSVSDTTVPGIYDTMDYPNMVAIDAPGFSDNRGEVQDIMNAIFVNQIKFANACKFVLVCDINDIIRDNISGFLSLISKINELIPNFDDLRSSVLLVMTKDTDEYTQDEIAALLKEKILKVDELNISQADRALIRCFGQQDELIGILRMPSKEGEVERNLDVNISGAFASTYPSYMNEVSVRFALSNDAQLVLQEIYQEFTDNLEFKDELNEIILPYQSYFHIDDYVFASTDEELQQTRRALNRLREQVFIQQNRFLRDAQAVLNSVTELVHLNVTEDFYKTLTLFVMLNEIGLLQQSFVAILVRKYRQTLRDLLSTIKRCIEKIEEEEEKRRQMDFQFKSANIVTGTAGTVAIGGALLRSLSMTTVATRVVGAFTGIGTVLTIGGAIYSIGSYLIKKEEAEKRLEVRARQERPMPINENEHRHF